MRDKRRGMRRGRIGLLIGIMALLVAILVPGGTASSDPVRAEVGVLRLHLDNDGRFFRFDTGSGGSYTPGSPQNINGSCPVTSLTGPQWVNLTGGSTSFSLNQVGLSSNSLGIRFLNCGRVDAPNWSLRLQLGTGIDGPGVGIDRAELDLQGWSNATAVADLFLDGTKVDTVQQAISGSGSRAIMVIDRTGKSLFDEVRLHPKNPFTSVALRGGGSGSPAAGAGTLRATLGTNDTLFRVVSESNLSVTKTAVATPVTAGGNAEFDITVTNNGAAVSNVGVSDALPAGLTWSIASQTASACSIASGVLTCAIPSLAGGASYSVRVSAPVTKAGIVENDPGATVTVNNAPVATSGSALVTVLPGAPLLTFDPPNGAQPTLTKLGDCINSSDCTSGGVKVYAEDQFQNPVNGSIAMSIGTDPTSTGPNDHATLSGTLTKSTVGGVATFPDLKIDRTSSGFQLLATLGSATKLSAEFGISNTDGSCTVCTATFPGGGPDGLPSTVSAPAGTTLIIETNQLDCSIATGIAGTVTIIPSEDGVVPIEFTDTIPLPVGGPFPFCKAAEVAGETVVVDPVPLCNLVNGFNQNPNGEVCVTEIVEFTGDPGTATLRSVLWIKYPEDPPRGKH